MQKKVKKSPEFQKVLLQRHVVDLQRHVVKVNKRSRTRPIIYMICVYTATKTKLRYYLLFTADNSSAALKLLQSTGQIFRFGGPETVTKHRTDI